ncbi:vacuolar protein-sorting protein 4 [Acrasis kona]|uniref:Vacuolar protein-sorting protein 4 n=1 Tax=Acrasis kona TaxID=1008807 RepID=A0AAW2YV11_9EUKA
MTQTTTTKTSIKRNSKRQDLLEEVYTSPSPSTPPQEEFNSSQEPSTTEDNHHQNDQLTDWIKGCIVTNNTNVSWKHVAGLDGAIQALHEAVILPIKYPHFFNDDRRPWRAILLYGPPGTGKTHLAKALATESKSTFFSVSSSDLLSKWMGESEKMVRGLFSMAEKKKPSIIFIDEVDSLVTARSENESETARRIKTEFLVRMQGLCEMDGVVVLAATNVPWELDPAMRRRFERRIYVPLPDKNARFKILSLSIKHTKNSLTHQDLMEIADETNDYSGSDLSCMVRNALMEPIRRLQNATHFKKCKSTGKYVPCEESDFEGSACNLFQLDGEHVLSPHVTKQDFMTSLARWRPSVNRADFVKHEEFTKEFGQD